MTREEFIEGYCRRSKVSWELLSERRVALPCYCGDETCEGWGMISKDLVDWHMQTDGQPRNLNGEAP